MLTDTHTHDINYLTLLLRDIQLINTECTPCKHRTDAESMQDLRSGYAGPTKSGHRTETLGAIRFFREKYLKPHFGNVSWEREL